MTEHKWNVHTERYWPENLVSNTVDGYLCHNIWEEMTWVFYFLGYREWKNHMNKTRLKKQKNKNTFFWSLLCLWLWCHSLELKAVYLTAFCFFSSTAAEPCCVDIYNDRTSSRYVANKKTPVNHIHKFSSCKHIKQYMDH